MMNLKTTWLVVAAALALSGCIGEMDGELEDAELETVERDYVRISSGYPALRSWSPWVRTSLFREATNRPTLVLTPYQESDKYFVAYGVDARSGTMVFAYRVPTSYYRTFLSNVSNEWQQMSYGFGDFNSLIRGSIKKPGPPIGPPIGTPPNRRFGALVVDAAMQGHAADDLLAAELSRAQ